MQLESFCIARTKLNNETYLAKICLDTAENDQRSCTLDDFSDIHELGRDGVGARPGRLERSDGAVAVALAFYSTEVVPDHVEATTHTPFRDGSRRRGIKKTNKNTHHREGRRGLRRNLRLCSKKRPLVEPFLSMLLQKWLESEKHSTRFTNF